MAEEGWRSYRHAAGAYARGRTDYPEAAVQALLAHLGVPPGGRVADLGAGTGILSDQLVTLGLTVDAVEPVAEMRNRMPHRSGLFVHDGLAERTGLPSGSVDAVLAATAWHWFDAARAAREARRLLRPGGGLGLIWTRYDEDVDWVRALAAVSGRRRPPTSPSASSGDWRRRFDTIPGWTEMRDCPLRTTRALTVDLLVERLRSSSVIAALDTAEQQAAEAELRALVEPRSDPSTGAIDVPYRTDYHWAFPV